MRLRTQEESYRQVIRNMNDVMKEMFLSDGMPEEIAEMMISGEFHRSRLCG